ncbi:MAG: DMT family transporter [Rhodobacterales bacterium]|nr:DMT family transporter [Rhodobacterales bacterium]
MSGAPGGGSPPDHPPSAASDAESQEAARAAGNLRGAFWMILSAILFVTMMSLIKHLGTDFHSIQIVLFRAMVGTAILVPLLLRQGGRPFRTPRWRLHLLRAVMAAGAIHMGFYALTHIPLADATAISFTRGLFMTPLAILFLGEKVGPHRWIALVVGLGGALLILRPGAHGAEGVHPAALAALAGAVLVACLSITVRKLKTTESNASIMVWPMLMVLVVTIIPAAGLWVSPTPAQWFLLILSGVVGTMAQWCIVQAFRHGEASALAPVDYVRLLLATAVGAFIFGEFPDGVTIVGGLIIVGSTFYTLRREIGKRRPVPVDTAP